MQVPAHPMQLFGCVAEIPSVVFPAGDNRAVIVPETGFATEVEANVNPAEAACSIADRPRGCATSS